MGLFVRATPTQIHEHREMVTTLTNRNISQRPRRPVTLLGWCPLYIRSPSVGVAKAVAVFVDVG